MDRRGPAPRGAQAVALVWFFAMMTAEIAGVAGVEGIVVGRITGVSDGIRTHDPRVHSPMLYH